MRSISVLLALCGIAFAAAQSSLTEGTVYYSAHQGFTVKLGLQDPQGVAWGSLDDQLYTTGWGTLKIQTNRDNADDQQMYAAGLLEGAITAKHIYEMHANMQQYFFATEQPSDALRTFLTSQDTWMRGQIKQLSATDPMWYGMNMIISQYDGLIEGYQTYGGQPSLDVFAFQLLNGVGDFLDLVAATTPSRRIDWENLDAETFKKTLHARSLCSVLIRALPDLSDIYTGHSSWFSFSATNRIFKHYNFDLNSPNVAARKISFSSYPGFLESLDDFYMMDSGLVMLQTTNNVFNQSLYELVHPNSLFAWHRVRLASLLSTTGEQWAKVVSQYNSGTYNNQYMVVDYKRWTAGAALANGTLWVVEQIPGLVESADRTEILAYGHWPSYNVPYFPTVYDRSGYPAVVAQRGPEYSYQMAPRAQIFRRDAEGVVDMASYKAIMRYNNYLNDPIAKGDPMAAICSRGDLRTTGASPDGCYDTKVTNAAWAKSLQADIISGPTTSHGLPPFSWAKFVNVSHYALPGVYDFPFVHTDPQWQ